MLKFGETTSKIAILSRLHNWIVYQNFRTFSKNNTSVPSLEKTKEKKIRDRINKKKTLKSQRKVKEMHTWIGFLKIINIYIKGETTGVDMASPQV